MDKARTGDLSFVFEPGFGFEQCVHRRIDCVRRRLTSRRRYVDYVLDVPMYFVYRDGSYIDASGQSFRDFMDGKLPAYPGHRPTMDDWEAHLTTVFPEVRLKRFLEMRGADNGPWRSICSLPALWVRGLAACAHGWRALTGGMQVGLLYDQQALDEAAALISDWTTEERAALRDQVPRTAMATPFRGGTVKDLSQRVVAIAKARRALRATGVHRSNTHVHAPGWSAAARLERGAVPEESGGNCRVWPDGSGRDAGGIRNTVGEERGPRVR